MLTGDRRLAPSRKLTVLGKVPKPINLPSQRLENHGLDPNVEIVPKGTLTWGSRPSLAAPNAWGTSGILSPRTDGSAGSPSHCPSSGGGTRPSTAGSDKSLESVSNAWGPNSRPSSASGILTSSQVSAAATRPRSAETRPGSSQLSRFADNLADNTASWVAAGSAGRLGTVLSKSSGFTLSSGDFPSLGSDKNFDTHSQRGHSSQGCPLSSQGRPASSQGRPASASEADPNPKGFSEPELDGEVAGNKSTNHLDHGTVINTWKPDNPAYAEHGASPNMENWHNDRHLASPYPSMNMPPPPYDSWHNPSFHPAEGSWYRGGAVGGPFRPPGSYPMDYTHDPARPLSNPQFPSLDAGPCGSYPNNCGPYRPYMPPERYMGPGRPDIQVRPGHYVEPVPYGPRPNVYNPNERETSIMGMVRPVHNQYPVQHENIHMRPGGYATVENKEQIKANQAQETQGQFRVLLKQHECSEDRDELEKRGHFEAVGSPHHGSVNYFRSSSQNGDDEMKSQMQETVSPCFPAETVSSQTSGVVDGRSKDVRDLVADSSNRTHGRRTEAANVQTRDLNQYPIIKKNATLMEKVESLNNKARMADSHCESGSVSREKSISSKNLSRIDQFAKVGSAYAGSAEAPAVNLNIETPTIKIEELNVLTEDKNKQSTTDNIFSPAPPNSEAAGEDPHIVGHKKVQGTRSIDSQTKLRSIRHDNEEWMKKPPGSESSVNSSRMSAKGGTLEFNASHEKQLCLEVGGVEGSHAASSLDPVDLEAQRAKMKEMAAQRAKQLQREEEEWTREQKAKARAKLEELNRRTLVESSSLKSNRASSKSSDVQNNIQDTGPGDKFSTEALCGTTDPHSEEMKQAVDSGGKKPAQTSSSSGQSSVVTEARAVSPGQEIKPTVEIALETTSDILHNTISRQKQVGYRKKNNILLENSTGGKQTTSSSIGNHKDTVKIEVNASSNDSLPNNKVPHVQHKKNNRSARSSGDDNDESLTSSTVSAPSNVGGKLDKLKDESGKTKHSTALEEPISVSSERERENETVGTLDSREVPMSERTEETHGKVSNRWKPHHPHRKNQQANKPILKYHQTEGVMWAPVKSTNKIEIDQVSQNNAPNGPKTKRAEIERYVPKPVAKELSQPDQQTAAASDSRNGEKYKHNKHGQTNSSWRQRSSTGSPSVEGSSFSDQLQTLNIDNLRKEQLTHTDDGWNDNENLLPSGSVTSTAASKSYGASRLRRQPCKVHRVSGNNYPASDNVDSRALGDNESEGRSIMKIDSQNAGIENIKPHWQPKSHRGNRGQRAESAPTVMNEEERTSSKRNPVAEAREAPDQDSRRERNVVPNLEKEEIIPELTPQNIGYRHGQYNGRNQRGHDNNYGGRNLSQDGSKQKFQTNEDKHIESYDKSTGSFQQNPRGGNVASEGSRTSGPRYRERGRNFSRGGGQF
ncbi:protein MODIFIER OF SNC1 1-like [Asparagus officinalis]|uniref:protein MODIFIER OF SNC1 1-like n=1 Tax=Asparagus officinalis TaxID=4686 RepID=UPI00098E2935|nr:protein MODIFIER OF SNC1 1-like [Asparagus officinalis]